MSHDDKHKGDHGKAGHAHKPDPEDRDDAVIAADDTGMLSGERLITEAEIREADPDRR